MLLFRYLRLWYCLRIRTSNTEPTLYVYMYAQIRVHDYTHREHLCVAVFWMLEFTRFQIAKTKRVRRFLYYVFFPCFASLGATHHFFTLLMAAVVIYTANEDVIIVVFATLPQKEEYCDIVPATRYCCDR